MVTLEQFLEAIKDGRDVEFEQTMAVIEDNFDYSPTSFRNGVGDDHLINDAGQNAGSCKIFAFARLQQLDPGQTLALFGRYYREDVLAHPEAQDHQNIRTFIRHGWAGIRFEGEALTPKN